MTITEEKINQCLQNLKTNEACGPDNIGNIILKHASSLAKSLKLIFQTCINKASFPRLWRTSEITPVFKEDNKADISQYRLISLLANVSKVLEEYFSTDYTQKPKKITPSPVRVQKEQISHFAAASIFQKIYRKTVNNENSKLRVLYIDFSKAFDRSHINHLYQKLFRQEMEGRSCSCWPVT